MFLSHTNITNTWRRCRFIEKLKNAFLFKVEKYIYHYGNIQNSIYLWLIDNNANEKELVNKYYKIRNNLKQTIQIYHTRVMRKEFINTIELCIVLLMFELGDPELITDLREINEDSFTILAKKPTYKSSLQFTCKLPIKFMVQTRQLRYDYEDAHYASALFYYQKEMNSSRSFLEKPVKCIMSILNLGLQCVGLMCNEMSEELEKIMKRCNSMDDICIFERLTLKEESFKTFKAASDEDICELWELLLEIDETLELDDRTKKSIKNKEKFQEFYNHCCKSRHYFFQIKKCGKADCNICKPLKSDEVDFSQVHSLIPDPIPTIDKTSYKEFSEIYGTITTEQHRPSLKHQ
ncbi:hypothetical protein RclHR1_16200004 [Rhizophagus clarus]|uniref:Uncharacterized protein n=1 Tax=Rhizophagus clarus TaxID=94130 RepID=A0A2Z6R9Y1_9GLOM|nr:hypothetical protein RclHR1_16200004 [Rhizophagus clarus]